MIGEMAVILALVVMNGIFSMSEMAVVSARKTHLKSDAEKGQSLARTALKLAEAPDTFFPTVQIGITLVGIAAGVYGGARASGSLAEQLRRIAWASPYADFIAYACVVTVITYLSLVIGELLPKRLAVSYPEPIAKVLSPFMLTVSRVFRPLVRVLEFSTNALFRLIPLRPADSAPVTEDEIRVMVAEGQKTGSIEKTEEEMVNRVLRLDDREAASLMTPRNELVWVDLSQPLEAIWRDVSKTPHFFFPAGNPALNKVHGIVSIKDLALCIIEKCDHGLDSVLRAPLRVPSAVSGLQVMELLKKEKKQIALVIDEHGDIDGLITLHDLLSAIVGDISGEAGEPEFMQREDGSYLIDGSMDAAEAFSLIKLRTPPTNEGAYHSLGGFVMMHLGHIPVTGENFRVDGCRFEVVDMDNDRVDKVLVAPAAPASE